MSISTGNFYCIPEFYSGGLCASYPGVYIGNYTISNSTPQLNNTSGCNTASHRLADYSNYKNDPSVNVPDLELGTTYNFTTTTSSIGWLGIYVDKNQDGDFDDAGELLYKNSSQWSGVNSGSFLLPADILPGKTMMRVIGTNQTEVLDPCLFIVFGEVEDYEVDVKAYPIATESTPGCVSATVLGVSGNGLIHFLDSNDDIIASINPNGQNLGDVTVEYEDLTAPQQTMAGKYFLPRNFNITSTNTFSNNVDVRLYLRNDELDAFNIANSSSLLEADLDINWFNNTVSNNDDCDFTNNSLSNGTYAVLNPTVNDYTVNTIDGFSLEFQINHFTEFGVGDGDILPVRWLNFSCTQRDNSNVLNWTTAAEVGNDYFEIERSIDGIRFDPIGRVEGQGTTQSNHRYSYTDIRPIRSYNYYRIKQYDIDGKWSFSDIIILKNQSESEIAIYPNPLGLGEDLLINTESGGSYEVNIYDSNGKHLTSRKIICQAGAITILSDIKFSAGIYSVQVVNSNKRWNEKLIIMK